MHYQYRCITNNPLLAVQNTAIKIEYMEIDNQRLFECICSEILSGYSLITHPLTGSIRPNITPYKSVLLSPFKGSFDSYGYCIITKAIAYTDMLFAQGKVIHWDEQSKKDFQSVDESFIKVALERNCIRL